MSILNIHDFLFLKLRLFRMTKYISCILFAQMTTMKRRRTTLTTWVILVYDDFNHNALVTISAGHDDTVNCVTIGLDREGRKSISDFSSGLLENTFHFCIMIFPDLPVNTTSVRIVKPPTIFITSYATTIMTWRNEFNRVHNHSFFSKRYPSRTTNSDISSASRATSSATR